MFSRNDRKWSSFRLKPKRFAKPQKSNKTTETLQDFYTMHHASSPPLTEITCYSPSMETFYPTPIATPEQKSSFYTTSNYEISSPALTKRCGGSILRNCSETTSNSVKSKKSVRINENISEENFDGNSSKNSVVNENNNLSILLNSSIASTNHNQAFSPRRMRWCENT